MNKTINNKSKNSKTCYEVVLHQLCNEKCLFCSQDHMSRGVSHKPSDDEILKRILYWYKEWYWMIGFTWWEPLIHRNFIKYVKFAKKVWFDFIRVQTNGVMLWNTWFVEKCIKAWLTLFKISVHHYKKDIHDYLVWYEWALDKILYGINEIKRLWARVAINIVLTKQNYIDLSDILLFYIDKWVTDFVIIFPLYENSMKLEVKKIWFKFSEVISGIVKSLLIFDKLWLNRPLVLNFPICLLPWYEESVIKSFNWTAVLNLDWTKTNIDNNKAWWKKRVKICWDCEYNKTCFWVDEEYLKYWWESEFIERIKKVNDNFNLDDLKIKDYFSDNELCLLEILNCKNNITVKEVSEIKNKIQICQHCDSMDKLWEVEESLLRKWYIKVTWEWMNRIFSKVVHEK